MKKSIAELVFADSLFILLLSLSSVFSGIASALFRFIAFALPVVLLLIRWKSEKTEIYRISTSPTKQGFKLTAYFLFPTILIIILFSFLSEFFLTTLFGVESASTDVSGNILYVIAVRALAPAIFEEMLFRYLPLRALGSHSLKLAIIYSSALFALSHCNLFQIPYALVAGVMFAALDLAAGSIAPSLIIHFVNNLFSIFMVRGADTGILSVILFISIAVLSAVSVIFILLKRKELKDDFLPILEDKSKVIFTYPLEIYAVMTVFIATTSLLT